jgi:plastocyanin
MNKYIIIGILVVVLIAGGGIYWFMQNQNSAGNALPYGATTTAQSPAPVIPVTPPPASAINHSPVPATNPAPTPTPPPAPLPMPATHAVTIQNFSFNPASITIKKGDTVVWTNKDPMGHTVTGNNGGPASQTISTNGTYSFTFNDVGTFGYHCSIHPSMKGTVVVTE